MATWSDLRRIALSLPGVSEGTSHGNVSWAVKKKTFAWERPLRRSDLEALGKVAPTGPILGLRTADLDLKDLMLASDPKVYFTTPHFDGYPAVLVRLDAISTKQLKGALVDAWLSRAPTRLAEAYLAKTKRSKP
jgi:hypothetical protein